MSQPLQEISTILAGIHDPELLEKFLRDILTPSEIGEISQRIQIVQALMSGTSQREIANTLWVSIATVTRGSRVVQFGDPYTRDYLHSLSQ